MDVFDVKTYVYGLGERARAAATRMARTPTAAKNRALLRIAEIIQTRSEGLLASNERDLEASADLEESLRDRLALNRSRIADMVNGLRQVAALGDPIGEITDLRYQPSGIQVGTMRVPVGVVGVIYESRPNVTADVAALTLKSGNAVILRGGSEALHSNSAIAECIHAGLADIGLPEDAVQLIETSDREAVGELLRMKEHIDVIVPRGGKGLIQRVSEEALMPVIRHLDGVCHVYVDDRADLGKAVAVAFNAKTQRYATCNTMETLLIARSVAKPTLERLVPLYREAGVELRGCEQTRSLVPGVLAATEQDWSEEYSAPILAIRVVDGLDEAITHINHYGSHHTEAIVTEDFSRARRFLTDIDSSSVMVNASTRFADGYEYGLGAEIGISTDKFHARGPVGLEGLTSKKYIVLGDGHIRA